MAEDRERFDELLERLNVKRAAGVTVMTTEEALGAANEIGYPVLMRPSYVLGGQNMIIAFDDDDIKEYMEIILRQEIENPILIDKYLMGIELEIDAICDGEDILIPGIMEHIEERESTPETPSQYIRHGISPMKLSKKSSISPDAWR